MKLCKSFEQRDDPAVTSSYHPIPFQSSQGSTMRKTRSEQFLPVHYFDYIGESFQGTWKGAWLTLGQLGLVLEGQCNFILALSTVIANFANSLIAIMLSRLRMTIDDCIEEYANMGADIFGSPRIFSMRGPIPWKREKYDYRKLEAAIKDVVNRRHRKAGQVSDSMYPSTPDRCRT